MSSNRPTEGKKLVAASLAALVLVVMGSGCRGFFVNPTISSLAIGPQSQTITASPVQTLQMSATATYSDGSTKDLTGQVAWTSSTTTCATIGNTGLVTPVSGVVGICNTTITAAFGTATPATTTVTVTEGTPTTIQLTASPTTPTPNSQVTFKALATFPNSNTPQDITTSVTWNISDTTNLTLTNGSTTGTIAAGAPANTQIVVSATFANVTSNSVTLTVQ